MTNSRARIGGKLNAALNRAEKGTASARDVKLIREKTILREEIRPAVGHLRFPKIKQFIAETEALGKKTHWATRIKTVKLQIEAEGISNAINLLRSGEKLSKQEIKGLKKEIITRTERFKTTYKEITGKDLPKMERKALENAEKIAKTK